ncbi:hypothetical protein ACGFJ7_14210 [Actinoplanes sp. NPDC048988]|uniref:hypothetical protein n=1 Tax=Actinoplanes sp. NPDC048988 TaxID=3363901 RepID=UPI00371961D3
MLLRIMLLFDRRRRLFMGATVAVGCGLVSFGDDFVFAVFPVILAVLLVSVVVSVVAYASPQPRVLLTRPGVPAFETGADVSAVVLLPGLIALGSAWVGGEVHAHAGAWSFGVLALLLLAVVAWRSPMVRLRPGGIEARRPFGSLVVPWDALPALAEVRRSRLTLTFGRPELVRRRGLWPLGTHSIPVTGVDAAFLGRAIESYSRNAGHRADIGREREWRRLQESLAGA